MIKTNFSTYGQIIYDTKFESVHSVEFLSRYKTDTDINIEQVFKEADDDSLVRWFLHQQKQALDFYNATGLEAHVNIDVGAFEYMYDNNMFENEDKNAAFTMEITQIQGLPDKHHVDCIKSCDKFKSVKVALDDYDIYNIVNKNLADYNFDIIKFDKSIVAAAEQDSKVFKHIKNLVRNNPDVDFIAEGMESIYQVQMMQSIGINLFQGYFFHKPEPLDLLLDRLKK